MADPTPNASGPYANKSFDAASAAIKTAQGDIDKFTAKAKTGALSEVEMIEFNMAASRYSTMVSMASGLIKNLTDTEKQVANKM